MSDRPVALVTGASRGIGKACAVDLARAGYDVAVSARTVRPGEQRDHSLTIAREDLSPLPGSLEETAALVEAEGGRASMIPIDLLDTDAVLQGARRVLAEWGRVDLLVNNGRYVGPGHMDRFLDAPVELIERQIQANTVAPLHLIKELLPTMVEQGSGLILNVTSNAGQRDPRGPAGEGGWGMAYGVSKGGFQRIAGVLARELAGTGVVAINLHPGMVLTERTSGVLGGLGFDTSNGAPPEVIGAVVAWLTRQPDLEEYNGVEIEAQDLCRELGLVPGWS